MGVKEGEWEVIGKSIGIQLKDLNQQQQTIAQKLISDTIFYAKMGQLCTESSISINATSRYPNSTFSYRRQTYYSSSASQTSSPCQMGPSPILSQHVTELQATTNGR